LHFQAGITHILAVPHGTRAASPRLRFALRDAGREARAARRARSAAAASGILSTGRS
jgi:hypothetical protein